MVASCPKWVRSKVLISFQILRLFSNRDLPSSEISPPASLQRIDGVMPSSGSTRRKTKRLLNAASRGATERSVVFIVPITNKFLGTCNFFFEPERLTSTRPSLSQRLSQRSHQYRSPCIFSLSQQSFFPETCCLTNNVPTYLPE